MRSPAASQSLASASSLANSAGRSGTHGDARGAGQGGEIQHDIRRLFAGVGQGVAQDHPAFGIGVVDFHAEALAGGDHFAGTERIGTDRVLDRGNQQGQAQRQLARHDQFGQGQRVRGAAHVLLHVAHAVGRLDVQAAGVEAHALADQGDMRQSARAPTQCDQARCPVRSAADRVDGGEIPCQQFVAGDHFDLRAMLPGDLARHRFQLLRAHVFGRRVDQVAHAHAGGEQVDGLGIGIAQQ